MHVDALETEIQDQVDVARAALLQARAEHDDYLADIHQSQLDALLRTADDHGLRVQTAPEVIDLTVADRERSAS